MSDCRIDSTAAGRLCERLFRVCSDDHLFTSHFVLFAQQFATGAIFIATDSRAKSVMVPTAAPSDQQNGVMWSLATGLHTTWHPVTRRFGGSISFCCMQWRRRRRRRHSCSVDVADKEQWNEHDVTLNIDVHHKTAEFWFWRVRILLVDDRTPSCWIFAILSVYAGRTRMPHVNTALIAVHCLTSADSAHTSYVTLALPQESGETKKETE